MAVIKGAIFDLDGVLLDSMGIWDDVDRAFFHAHGMEMPQDYVEKLNSMSFSEGAEYTRRLMGGLLTVDEITAEWQDLSVKLYAEDVHLKPGAAKFLESLSLSGIAISAATDLGEELAIPALKNNGIDHFFSFISTTKAAGKDKKSPDVYLKAAMAMSLRPSECIVFEDILRGIRTASSAGFMTAAIYDGSSDKDWPSLKKEADAAAESFMDPHLLSFMGIPEELHR